MHAYGFAINGTSWLKQGKLILSVVIVIVVLSVINSSMDFKNSIETDEPSHFFPHFGSQGDTCALNFNAYESSEWELEWYNNIETLRHEVCEKLATQTEKTVPVVSAILHWGGHLPDHNVDLSVVLPLLSRFTYKNNCTGEISYEYIEPLYGLLRDPFTICANVPSTVPQSVIPAPKAAVQSKNWMLGGAYANFKSSLTGSEPLQRVKEAPRRILIDLGSSAFGQWDADTSAVSTAYLYGMFKNHGVPFDRVFAYEYSKLNHHELWENTPEDVVVNGKYTLINHGVESDPTSKFNPWNLIRHSIRKEDYLVVKLDIDTARIENPLMDQLVADPVLLNLVDEFYFEHHVYVKEMQKFWGVGPETGLTLATSYQLFTKLRQHGVRMHSWP